MSISRYLKILTPWIAALWSVSLGVLAFPNFNHPELAWLVFVPWVVWASQEPKPQTFLLAALLAETLRWLLTLIWLRHVTWAGTLAIATALAGLHTLWFLLLLRLTPRLSTSPPCLRLTGYLMLSACWVLIEWLRTQPWAFPWAPLALSQWERPALLFFTAWTGAWGLSFLIILGNLCIGLTISRWLRQSKTCGRWIPDAAFCGVLIVLLAFLSLIPKSPPDEASTRVDVTLVQPWQAPQRVLTAEDMYANAKQHFAEASRATLLEADWMAWPEGALNWPLSGPNNVATEVGEWVSEHLRKPLLTGNHGFLDHGLINGVYLFYPDGSLDPNVYAKRILVPFGEYIPFGKLLGDIQTVVPIGSGFVPGKGPVMLTVPHHTTAIRVAPLVCYEDCFPQLARASVRAGAQILFVATYNAWYGEEHGAYQHAAHSVLRAAENLRPVFRCGSAGWSGWIGARGHIREVLTDDNGSIYFRGSGVISVEVPDSRSGLSFYCRFGDWFVGLCLIFLGIGCFLFRIPFPGGLRFFNKR